MSRWRFHDSFYAATHVVFMISAYSAVKLDPRDVPWLFQSATSNTDRESHSFSLLWPSQLQYFMALEDV